MPLYRTKVTLVFILFSSITALSQSFDFERIESAVYFKFDSSELTSEAKSVISNMFPYDSEFYPEYITITGFTDKSGNKDYNRKLSNQRAQTVEEFISENHISNTEFRVESMGEEQPAYSCDDNLNRCVKILMVLKEKEKPSSLAKCKELFPEEFTVEINQDLVQELDESSKSADNQTKTKVELPASMLLASNTKSKEKVELPASLLNQTKEDTLDDSNKFQRKVVTKENDSLRLHDILFYGNSAKYFDSAEPELAELAEFLNSNSDYIIAITGHVNVKNKNERLLRKVTDFENAYELSLARADAVKKFLVENGVSSKRISVDGKGGEEPIFKRPKTNAENTANRRIEIVFIKINTL